MKEFLEKIRIPDKNLKLSRKIINTSLIFLLGIILGIFSKWLDNLSIELSIKCGENGKTFGSVTSKEIADKLLSLGFEIDKKKIDFSPVKTIGLYHVKIKLHPQVATTINVNIVSQK